MNGPTTLSARKRWKMKLKMKRSVSGCLTEDRHSLEQVCTMLMLFFFLFPAVGETFLYKAVLKFISHVAVRGMMYYKQALDLQYFLEFSSDPGLYPYLSLWKMVDPKFASSFIGCMYCSYLFLIPSFLSFSLFLFMQ